MGMIGYLQAITMEELRAFLQNPVSIKTFLCGEPTDDPDEDGVSVGKSWHSLHYLITGSAEEIDSPLGNAILGEKKIGPDLGYGPARFLDATQVREVSFALNKVAADDLARRFNLDAMKAAKVYACHDKGELELAQHYFQHLVKYYAEAAKRGDAMLLYFY